MAKIKPRNWIDAVIFSLLHVGPDHFSLYLGFPSKWGIMILALSPEARSELPSISHELWVAARGTAGHQALLLLGVGAAPPFCMHSGWMIQLNGTVSSSFLPDLTLTAAFISTAVFVVLGSHWIPHFSPLFPFSSTSQEDPDEQLRWWQAAGAHVPSTVHFLSLLDDVLFHKSANVGSHNWIACQEIRTNTRLCSCPWVQSGEGFISIL